VDVPAGVTPRSKERNLHFAREVTEAHGRRMYTWATQDVPQSPDREPFEADSIDSGRDRAGGATDDSVNARLIVLGHS
jgi:hypothetical protein